MSNSVIKRLMGSAARVSKAVQCDDFTMGSMGYRGIFTKASVDEIMQSAGKIGIDEYTLSAEAAQFGTRPVVGDAIEWNGASWKVKLDLDPQNTQRVLVVVMRKWMHR